MVRVPDWWKATSPPRPVVNVKIGEGKQSKLTAESLLDFQVDVTLEGEPLSEREIEALLASAAGLVSLRGKWVELDRDSSPGHSRTGSRWSGKPKAAVSRSYRACAYWPARIWEEMRQP